MSQAQEEYQADLWKDEKLWVLVAVNGFGFFVKNLMLGHECVSGIPN